MRNVVTILAAFSLLGCSAAPTQEQEISGARDAASANGTPVMTFVDAPSSIQRGSDGEYRIGFALSFTDCTYDGAHTLHFQSKDFALEAPLPLASPNTLVSPSFVLPRATVAGTLDFTLTIVAKTGGASTPYRGDVYLL